MHVIGRNLKLRRLEPSDWKLVETTVRNGVDRIEGAGILSMTPGLMEIELTGPTAIARSKALEALRRDFGDWQFSESGSYSLSTPVSMRVVE